VFIYEIEVICNEHFMCHQFFFNKYNFQDDLINDHVLCEFGEPVRSLKTSTAIIDRQSKDFLIVSTETSQITIRDANTGALMQNVSCTENIYSFIMDEPYLDGFGAGTNKSVLYCRTTGDEIVSIDVMVSIGERIWKSSFNNLFLLLDWIRITAFQVQNERQLHENLEKFHNGQL
jgi:hypothetical protein